MSAFLEALHLGRSRAARCAVFSVCVERPLAVGLVLGHFGEVGGCPELLVPLHRCPAPESVPWNNEHTMVLIMALISGSTFSGAEHL